MALCCSSLRFNCGYNICYGLNGVFGKHNSPDLEIVSLMRDLESEGKKFFRIDTQKIPACLLHGQPNCKVCTEVYVAVALRQMLRTVREKVR